MTPNLDYETQVKSLVSFYNDYIFQKCTDEPIKSKQLFLGSEGYIAVQIVDKECIIGFKFKNNPTKFKRPKDKLNIEIQIQMYKKYLTPQMRLFLMKEKFKFQKMS